VVTRAANYGCRGAPSAFAELPALGLHESVDGVAFATSSGQPILGADGRKIIAPKRSLPTAS
jgi:hypothetical protein